VSDIIDHYTHNPIVGNNQRLEFAVKANSRDASSQMNDSTMQRVIQIMRQSSTGVNLISKRASQYIVSGYLFMKKGESAPSIMVI